MVDFLNANRQDVLASRHQVPREMAANSALVGSAPYGAWGKVTNPIPPTSPSQGVAHDSGDVSIPCATASA